MADAITILKIDPKTGPKERLQDRPYEGPHFQPHDQSVDQNQKVENCDVTAISCDVYSHCWAMILWQMTKWTDL